MARKSLEGSWRSGTGKGRIEDRLFLKTQRLKRRQPTLASGDSLLI
jgi:hypothetical protein